MHQILYAQPQWLIIIGMKSESKENFQTATMMLLKMHFSETSHYTDKSFQDPTLNFGSATPIS
jgi:hypothetical protein